MIESIWHLKLLLMHFAFIVSSFFIAKTDSISLPGKIAVNVEDSFYVHDNSNAIKYSFPIEGKNFNYGGFSWLNRINGLVGIEYLSDKNGGTGRGNLACFSSTGRITRTIYKAKHGEIVSYACPSRKDKRLLFAIERKGDIKVNPLEGLNREKSLQVLDFNSGKLVTQIKSIGTSLTFELHESPWVYDEDRFVYSLSNDKQIMVDDTAISSLQDEKRGVYIYHVITNQKALLVPKGRFAVCSPIDLCIGYIIDQAVWTMNLKDKSTKKLFEVGLQDRIINIHWTPDGKFMYIAYYKQNNTGREIREEKLIDVKTKNQVDFKKIGHGFRSYTWK